MSINISYNLDEKAIIWLSSFDFLSHKKEELLLSLFTKPRFIFSMFENNKEKILKIVSNENLIKMNYALSDSYLDSYINSLNNQNIRISTKYSETYPKQLLDVDEAPFILFCKGDISLLSSPSIAIVGTRQPSSYGKNITELFSKKLAENGLTIVSGLAYGVDTIAHQAALDVGGKTIAVLGAGFNNIYPQSNVNLAKEIENNGLLVTEYKPSISPSVYTFPYRNRIIAGLTRATLITEAGEKSGALITKEYALDCGKDIFVIPGNITSKTSYGCNRLIKSCQAALVMSYEDILNALNIEIKPIIHKTLLQLDYNEKLIISELEDSDKNYEHLKNRLGLEAKTLNSYLTSMQIRGIIKKLPGNTYSNLHKN